MSEIKRGTLKYYHRGLLNKKWKEYRCVLYDSSLLTWYSDIKHKKPDGMVLLKDVERFICVGPYTKCLPDFPHLDNEYDQVALIAFPMSIKDRDRELVWLLCEDIEDLNSWMKSIVQTLPSHALRMEKMANISSQTNNEDIQIDSELNSPQINTPEAMMLKTDSIGLPLVAGFIGTRLQGHTMNSKENPLQKAGYDYGDTLWGTGEGWGHFSSLNVPGYAGLGGSGCYSNHIDLIRNEDDEQRLKEVEDQIGVTAEHEDAVEVATYELSKNRIEDQGEENTNNYSKEESEDDDDDTEENDVAEFLHIEEDFKMIDSDVEK